MPETIKRKKRTGDPSIYLATDVVVDDELSRLKKIVYLFSCHKKMSGASSNVLREKLILLVALYLKYGYNDEAKNKASDILGVQRSAINSMNLELRNARYLIKDAMNNRINHLHKDLEELRKYVNNSKDEPLYFLVRVSSE